MIGFSAAVATNVIECVQNVFSKRLLAHEYSASQLQFYTSLTALVLQAPLLMLSASSTSTAPVSAAPLSLGWVDNSTLNGVDHMAGNMTLLADRAQCALPLAVCGGVCCHDLPLPSDRFGCQHAEASAVDLDQRARLWQPGDAVCQAWHRDLPVGSPLVQRCKAVVHPTGEIGPGAPPRRRCRSRARAE
eukprot:UN4003